MFCRVSFVILIMCALQVISTLPYSSVPYKRNYPGGFAPHPVSYLQNRNVQYTRTFYDSRQNIMRPLNGGGQPVFVSYNKRCPYNGMRASPCRNSNQHYYACYNDCVVYAKCDPNQFFDFSKQTCQPRLSRYSDPELPPCQQNGFFASPYNCNVYYNCQYNKYKGVFFQMKLRCPLGQCFNPQTRQCEYQNPPSNPMSQSAPTNSTGSCNNTVPKIFITAANEFDLHVETCDDGNCPSGPNTNVIDVNGKPLLYVTKNNN